MDSLPLNLNVLTLRTTGRLAKTNEVSIFKPIRDIVRIVMILERSESILFRKWFLIGYQNINIRNADRQAIYFRG